MSKGGKALLSSGSSARSKKLISHWKSWNPLQGKLLPARLCISLARSCFSSHAIVELDEKVIAFKFISYRILCLRIGRACAAAGCAPKVGVLLAAQIPGFMCTIMTASVPGRAPSARPALINSSDVSVPVKTKTSYSLQQLGSSSEQISCEKKLARLATNFELLEGNVSLMRQVCRVVRVAPRLHTRTMSFKACNFDEDLQICEEENLRFRLLWRIPCLFLALLCWAHCGLSCDCFQATSPNLSSAEYATVAFSSFRRAIHLASALLLQCS